MFAAMLLGCADQKPQSPFEQAFDDADTPWKEVEAQLPPKPVASDLMGFSVSGATQYRFWLDTKSLSIGEDGVFRYTVVATSPQGVRNVSYEGIRCDAHQRKIYAIGRPDGSWVRARNAAWVQIEEVGNNRQHAALEKEYFCPDGYNARSVRDIVGRLASSPLTSEGEFDRQTGRP